MTVRRLISIDNGTSVRGEGLGIGHAETHQLSEVLDIAPDDAQWTQVEVELVARMLEGSVRHVTASEVRYTVSRLVRLQRCHLILDRHSHSHSEQQQQQSRADTARATAQREAEAEQQLRDDLYDALAGDVSADGRWWHVGQWLQPWSPEAAGTLLAEALTQRAALPQRSQTQLQSESHPQLQQLQQQQAAQAEAQPAGADREALQPAQAAAAAAAAAAAEPAVHPAEAQPDQRTHCAAPAAAHPAQTTMAPAAHSLGPSVPPQPVAQAGAPQSPALAGPSAAQPPSRQPLSTPQHQQSLPQQLPQPKQQHRVKDEDVDDAQPIGPAGPCLASSRHQPALTLASVPAPALGPAPAPEAVVQRCLPQLQSRANVDNSAVSLRDAQPRPPAPAPQVRVEPAPPQALGPPPPTASAAAQPQPAPQPSTSANLPSLTGRAPARAVLPARRSVEELPSHLQPRPRQRPSADPGVAAVATATAAAAAPAASRDITQRGSAATSCAAAFTADPPISAGPSATQKTQPLGAGAPAPAAAPTVPAPAPASVPAPAAASVLPGPDPAACRAATAEILPEPAVNGAARVAAPPPAADTGQVSGLNAAKDAEPAGGLQAPRECGWQPDDELDELLSDPRPQPCSQHQPRGQEQPPQRECALERPTHQPQEQLSQFERPSQQHSCFKQQRLAQQPHQKQQQEREREPDRAARRGAAPLPSFLRPSNRIPAAARTTSDHTRTASAPSRLAAPAPAPAAARGPDAAAAAAAAGSTGQAPVLQPGAGQQVQPLGLAPSSSKATPGSVTATSGAAGDHLPTAGSVTSKLTAAVPAAAPGGGRAAAEGREAPAADYSWLTSQPRPDAVDVAMMSTAVAAQARHQSSTPAATQAWLVHGPPSVAPAPAVRVAGSAPATAPATPGAGTGPSATAVAGMEPTARLRSAGSAGALTAGLSAAASQPAAPAADDSQQQQQQQQNREGGKGAPAAPTGADEARRANTAAESTPKGAATTLATTPAPKTAQAPSPTVSGAGAEQPHSPFSTPATAPVAAAPVTPHALPLPRWLCADSSCATFNVLAWLEKGSSTTTTTTNDNNNAGAIGRRDSVPWAAQLPGTGSEPLSPFAALAAKAAAVSAAPFSFPAAASTAPFTFPAAASTAPFTFPAAAPAMTATAGTPAAAGTTTAGTAAAAGATTADTAPTAGATTVGTAPAAGVMAAAGAAPPPPPGSRLESVKRFVADMTVLRAKLAAEREQREREARAQEDLRQQRERERQEQLAREREAFAREEHQRLVLEKLQRQEDDALGRRIPERLLQRRQEAAGAAAGRGTLGALREAVEADVRGEGKQHWKDHAHFDGGRDDSVDGNDGNKDGDEDGGEDMELDSPPSAAAVSAAKRLLRQTKAMLNWGRRVRAFLRSRPERSATYRDIVNAGMAVPRHVLSDNYHEVNAYLGRPVLKGFFKIARKLKKESGEYCLLKAVDAGRSRGGGGSRGSGGGGGDAPASAGDGFAGGGGGDGAVSVAANNDAASGGGGPHFPPAMESEVSYMRRLYDHLVSQPDGLAVEDMGSSPVPIPDHLLGRERVGKWLKDRKLHWYRIGPRLYAKHNKRP